MPKLRTLPEALAGAAQSAAGYCFVIGGVDTHRSYADIYRGALQVSRSLKESGLRRGDRADQLGYWNGRRSGCTHLKRGQTE